MKVYKFGGRSVRGVRGIINLEKIVSNRCDEPVLIVVTAIGETTHSLEEVATAFFEGSSKALELLQVQKAVHKEMAAELGLDEMISLGVLDDFFAEAEWLLEDDVQDPYDYVYDQIVAIGDLLSARLLEGYLQKQGFKVRWIDARDVVKTNDTYRAATVDTEKTTIKVDQLIRPALDESAFVVIAGGVGSTQELNTSTLGGEGADYSAAMLAEMLGANELTVLEDV